MRFGVHLPQFGRIASPEAIQTAAVQAEELDFDNVWASDHLAVAQKGRHVPSYFYEPLVTLTWAAAVTSRILRPTGEPIRIDWRLLRRGESWRIVDVVVEGMSMVLSQRSEYAAVIKGDGGKIEGLLVKLREKTSRLRSAGIQKADSTQ